MFDIVSFIHNNLSDMLPVAQNVATGVLAAVFFRRKNRIETDTQEFAKLKAGRLDEATEMLINSGQLSYTELYKMKNYYDIAKKADEYLKVKEIDTQNFDWHTRFFEACGNISDEDLQEIWARLLAREIEEPNTHSLRTMECLRNLSKEEAELFNRVCHLSVCIDKSVLLPRIGGIMEEGHITYDDILKLDDCGLLKSDAGLSIGIQVGNDYSPLVIGGEQLILVRKREGCDGLRLDIQQHLFTRSGRELFSIINTELDLTYFCKKLNEEYQIYEFVCGQIIARNGDQIQYVLLKVDSAESVIKERE